MRGVVTLKTETTISKLETTELCTTRAHTVQNNIHRTDNFMNEKGFVQEKVFDSF